MPPQLGNNQRCGPDPAARIRDQRCLRQRQNLAGVFTQIQDAAQFRGHVLGIWLGIHSTGGLE